VDVPPGIDDVFLEEVLADLVVFLLEGGGKEVVLEPVLSLLLALGLLLIHVLKGRLSLRLQLLLDLRVALHVRIQHKSSQSIIILIHHLILDHRKNVKPGEDRICEVYVVDEVEGGVVVAFDRVCGSNDAAPGLEGSDYASLRDGDGLLLHSLMDGSPVLVIHLIKFINQADPSVCQDQGASLQCPLPSHRVLVDASSQPHSTGAFPSGIDAAVEDLLHVLQELRLGSSRVSQEQHVDVPSDPVLSSNIFGFSAKHGESKAFLDELMAIDGWSHGVDDPFADVGLPREVSDLVLVLVRQLEHLLVPKTFHQVCLDDRLEHREAVLYIRKVVKSVDVDASDLNLITGPGTVDQVIEQVHFLLSGDSPWGDRPWRLLDGHFLIVPVESFLLIHRERPITMALDALPNVESSLILGVVVEGTLDVSTLTSEVDLELLWEHSSSFGDDPSDLDEGVEMDLAEVSQLVFHWQILDPHKDLVVDVVVLRVQLNGDV